MVDELLAAVKYRFIVAIEACIDVGRHVVASEGLRAPADYDVRVVQILRERVDDLVTFRSALARAAGG